MPRRLDCPRCQSAVAFVRLLLGCNVQGVTAHSSSRQGAGLKQPLILILRAVHSYPSKQPEKAELFKNLSPPTRTARAAQYF